LSRPSTSRRLKRPNTSPLCGMDARDQRGHDGSEVTAVDVLWFASKTNSEAGASP
jgi:hypothetical protein